MAALLIGLLCLLLAQRFAFLIAALLPAQPRGNTGHAPPVKVLVAARDEQANLPLLLRHLERLDYPEEKLSFVLVSDGSRDRTAALMEEWCSDRPRAGFLRLDKNFGKAAALQLGWRAGPASELTAVFDADVQPRRDSLRRLAREFDDPKVGVVSGSCLPSPPFSTLVARYAALEMWVYQLVNQAGRDRLGLDPPAIGANSVYRTAALIEIGGFPQDATSEDVEVSLALVRGGWRTRFLAEASAGTRACGTLAQFWMQRQRWTRGLHRAGRRVRGPQTLSVVTGYVDRLVFLGTSVAALFGEVAWFWPLLYLTGPALSVWAGLHRAKQKRKLPFLLSCVPMFVVDLAVTFLATAASLSPLPAGWLPRRASRRQT